MCPKTQHLSSAPFQLTPARTPAPLLARCPIQLSLTLTCYACCQDDDAGGDEDDQGGFNDLYDMDDEFIDDAELRDYFGSDRRKTKYSGFFVNKVSLQAAYTPCPCLPTLDSFMLRREFAGLVQAGPASVSQSMGCRCFGLKE